jgi:hypothetical protein
VSSEVRRLQDCTAALSPSDSGPSLRIRFPPDRLLCVLRGYGVLQVIDALDVERVLPATFAQPLAEPVGNECLPTFDGRALRLEPITADAVSELLEIRCVRIRGRLLASLHRGCLPPVRLGLEPFAEFACAVCVHLSDSG